MHYEDQRSLAAPPQESPVSWLMKVRHPNSLLEMIESKSRKCSVGSHLLLAPSGTIEMD